MNGLSLISFFNAYSFIILAIYILKLNREEILNRLAALVCGCFAFWSLAYTFFYASPTVNSAMIWHRISSIGWILFCVFAAHFFLILSEKAARYNDFRWYISLYALPVFLILKSLLTAETPVAKGILPSSIGWGWTYDSNISSLWYWMYILYIVSYLGGALYLTYEWSKKSNILRLFKQSKSIILLDIIMIAIGSFTDLILPAISPVMPPIFNVISITWGIGFFYIVKKFKLMDMKDTISPDLIIKTVMDPILVLDNNGVIIKCNEATQNLLKYDLDEILNKPLSDFCNLKEYGEELLYIALNEKVLHNVEIDIVNAESKVVNTLVSFSVADSPLDGLVGLVVGIHDITKQKMIEAELYKRKEKYKELSEHLNVIANYDKLTKIPNRRLFFHKLEEAIKNYKIDSTEFALVFIDLDGFKAVNDSYGHDIGDLLLVNVSKIFVESIRKQDVIARVGGDEFVIIISDLKDDLEIENIIEKMRDKFSQSIIINNKTCPVGISYGISKCPEDGITTDELMKISDERMYENKTSKKKKMVVNR